MCLTPWWHMSTLTALQAGCHAIGYSIPESPRPYTTRRFCDKIARLHGWLPSMLRSTVRDYGTNITEYPCSSTLCWDERRIVGCRSGSCQTTKPKSTFSSGALVIQDDTRL